MSTIAPNGQIRFLSEVPIDDTYENTLYFENKTAQTTYFLGLTPVHTMTQCSRVRDNVIRVDALSDTLLTCNYLMFQNTNFSNKWFYAFIENIRYVNNVTTEIVYRIDEIQTWLFDEGITIGQCFIEREHTRTDGMFEHLIDEGHRVSEYVNNTAVASHAPTTTYKLDGQDAFIFAGSDVVNVDPSTQEGDVVTADPQSIWGNFTGATVRTYHVRNENGTWDETEWSRMQEYLSVMATNQQTDSIIGGILFPRNFITHGSNIKNPITPETLSLTRYQSGDPIDGYVPKNKKMYNAPYCVHILGTSEGQEVVLQPEYTESSTSIKLRANVSMTPSILATPVNYRGKPIDWENSISLNSFPQFALSLDGYKAWVASGALDRLTVDTATSLIKDSVKLIEGGVNVVGGQEDYSAAAQFGTESAQEKGISRGAKGLTQVVNAGADIYSDIRNAQITMDVAKSLPPNLKGSTNTHVLSTYNEIEVFVQQRCINHDVARSIDNYFTMFGYMVNRVDTPRLKNRSRFTFIKTKGCKINGGAPSDSLNRLQNIFNKGIRFWVSASDVGNYTLANNPI